jgi:hypothetical protein
MQREPIQIAITSDENCKPILIALANDGSLWATFVNTLDSPSIAQWNSLRDLPED